MNFYEYINTVNFFFNAKLFLVEEIIVIALFYNFIKLLILGSLVELIWPTQFFNRKNNIGFNFIRYRTYTETIIKLRRKTKKYKAINKILFKYFFVKK